MRQHGGSQVPLRISVDARSLNVEHIRGMGNYLREILPRLARREDVEVLLFGERPDLPRHVSESNGKVAWRVFEYKGYRFHTWEQIGLPWRAKKERASILHAAQTTLPLWQPVPTVVTVHDTIPWASWNEGMQQGLYRDFVIPKALKRAKEIITISEASRVDILRLWPELEGRITVIRHGISNAFLRTDNPGLANALEELGVRSPYLLYVGGQIPRKRFEWAVDIFERMEHPSLQLVTVGLAPDAPVTQRVAETFGPRRFICLRHLHENDIVSAYQNACAVLYPTLYEGFGLPVLESQAVGTPVLFSNVGSLGELIGPGSEVLAPEDCDAWVGACRRVVKERELNLSPNENARRWAQSYSWDRSAEEHLKVYRRASQ